MYLDRRLCRRWRRWFWGRRRQFRRRRPRRLLLLRWRCHWLNSAWRAICRSCYCSSRDQLRLWPTKFNQWIWILYGRNEWITHLVSATLPVGGCLLAFRMVFTSRYNDCISWCKIFCRVFSTRDSTSDDTCSNRFNHWIGYTRTQLHNKQLTRRHWIRIVFSGGRKDWPVIRCRWNLCSHVRVIWWDVASRFAMPAAPEYAPAPSSCCAVQQLLYPFKKNVGCWKVPAWRVDRKDSAALPFRIVLPFCGLQSSDFQLFPMNRLRWILDQRKRRISSCWCPRWALRWHLNIYGKCHWITPSRFKLMRRLGITWRMRRW